MTHKALLTTAFAGIFFIGIIQKTNGQQYGQKLKIHKATAKTYLNGGVFGNNDSISVARFDSLLSKKLVVKDSVGNVFPVSSFRLVYLNRGVFADKYGHPIIQTTPIAGASVNGLLPDYWRKGLISQVKAGDTAVFTDIRYYRRVKKTIQSTDSNATSNIEQMSDSSVNKNTDNNQYDDVPPLLYGETIKIVLIP